MDPKTLILDIETSPITAYSWGPKYDTNLIEILHHGNIIAYSAKWLNGKQITKGLPDYPGYKKDVVDDRKLVKDLRNILNEAEIVVTQNGNKFDIPMINARIAKHNLSPASSFQSVDTLVSAHKAFKFPSYSLNDMCAYFGIGQKQEHEGFPLWKKCIAGDMKAWARMLKYNKHDVELTEELYLRIRPFIKKHPSWGLFKDRGDLCPRCGSNNIQARGTVRNLTTVYKRYQCSDCGGWGRSTKNVAEFKPVVAI